MFKRLTAISAVLIAMLAVVAIPASAATGGVSAPAHSGTVTGGVSASPRHNKCARHTGNGKHRKCHKPIKHGPIYERTTAKAHHHCGCMHSHHHKCHHHNPPTEKAEGIESPPEAHHEE